MMKKKIVVLLLMLMFVAGSSSAAIVITDQAGLQAIGTDVDTLDGDYVLGNDIVLTGAFTSIMEFTGTFDGAMHTIDGLTTTTTGTRNSAIFGRTVAGSVVKNVGMTNVSINFDASGTNANYVAALINDSKGVVDKCWLDGGSIIVTGATGGNNTGSLIGTQRGTGAISNSYARDVIVLVDGMKGSGGFVNQSAGGTITNCYVDAAVMLAPRDDHTMLDYTAGFARDSSGTGDEITSCYYNMDTTLMVQWPTATNDDGSGMGRTTAELLMQSTYVGWDFANTWTMEEGVSTPTLIPEPMTLAFLGFGGLALIRRKRK